MWFLLALALAEPPTPPPMLWTGCTWTDAPFQKHAVLRVPGSGGPVADVYGGSGQVTVTGILGQDFSGLTAFSGVWSREGVSVAGWASRREGSLFRLSGEGPIDLGPAAKLVVGGDLDVVGYVDGGPVVRAHRWAREDTRRWREFATLPCERLSVTRGAQWDNEKLVLSLFPDGFETRIARKTKLKLREVPGGPVELVLRPEDYQRRVWVVQKGGGAYRIAVPHWTGVVWFGWVDELPEPEDGDGSVGMGLLGGLSGDAGEPIPAIRCDGAAVLWAASKQRRLPVGSVAPGRTLERLPEVESAGGVPVTVGYWVVAREAWHFEIDEAPGCAPTTIEKPGADLDEVFGELEE